MNTRINLLEVLAYLNKSDLIAAVEILVLDETYRRSVCKLRCRLLPSKYQLSVRFIQTKTELIYAYQLFSSAPLARWDNEPHFPKLASFPHHFHDRMGTVFDSPLSGDVFVDLDIVLAAIPTIISELELTA